MKVEVCLDLYESYKNIKDLPISQIEVCKSLTLGGLTPTVGLVSLILKDKPKFDLKVMLRPRMGDFYYNEEEFCEMKENLILFSKMGIKHFVIGLLLKDNKIDLKRIKELIKINPNLKFSFHRAFDLTPNLNNSLDELIKLGFSDILTSGGENKAELGIKKLEELIICADNKINIIPGSGINKDNVLLFKNIGAKAVHLSGKEKMKSKAKVSKIVFNDYNASDYFKNVSQKKNIKELLEVVNNE